MHFAPLPTVCVCNHRLRVVQGVFVVLVQRASPAALAGLRFGDQLLQIDGENVAGYSVDKVHSIIKKGPANGIRLAVRDRPFERTVSRRRRRTHTHTHTR